MCPLGLTAPPGRLPGFDRAPAALADLSRDMGGVVFLSMLALVEVGTRKLSGLAIADIHPGLAPWS
jgi:hypothetical protein